MRTGVATATLTAALMLSACGGGDDTMTVEPGGTPAPAGGSATALTIELDDSGAGLVRTFTLTCDPVGGDHPDAQAACAALADAGGVPAFAPVPADMMCTQIYGGPQTAHVTGTVDGAPVDARFSRTDGCEISRWDRLAPLLGTPGGAQGS